MYREIIKTGKSGQEDEVLIKNFLANDVRSFDRLVIKYKDMIFNLCFRMLGDYDEADDCSQETFIKVYNNLRSFRYQSSFLTWLYRIAVNTCRNRMASMYTRINKRTVRIDNPADDGSEPREIRDSSYDPNVVFEKNEQKRNIHAAISSLPKELKMLVILRDMEGKPYEDIAEITGTAIGTVKSRLARARHLLREKLKGVL
jgi:RNA polymerase sigma-70 factor (ECF subfamily)